MAKKKPRKPKRVNKQPGRQGIPPELHAEIRRLHLCGYTTVFVAEKLGLAYDTVRSFIRSKLEPELLEASRRHVKLLLAEVQQLKCYAWGELYNGATGVEVTIKEGLIDQVLEVVEKIKRSASHKNSSTWTNVIQWCLEMEAKIGGHFNDPSTGDDSTLRVAGSSRQQVTAEMFEQIEMQVLAYREQEKEAAAFR